MEKANEFYLVLLLIMSVLVLIGVIFLCIGIGLISREKRKKATCTQLIVATVVDMQHKAIGASGYADTDEAMMMSWFPVYEYIVNGTVKRNQAFAGTAKPEVPIGQKVALYVNPERPDEFYCPDEKKVPVQKVFAGVGVLCVSIAVILGVVLCIN